MIRDAAATSSPATFEPVVSLLASGFPLTRGGEAKWGAWQASTLQTHGGKRKMQRSIRSRKAPGEV